MITIDEAIQDPRLFGQLFRDLETWAAWRAALKAIFGIPLDKKELKIFQAATGRAAGPSDPAEECFFVVGRRGGKSRISAVIACYLALFFDWSPFLDPGETGHIVSIAADRPQANNLLNYVKGILAQDVFRGQVKAERAEAVDLTNGITISVKTCDYRLVRGYTIVAAILDELAFWRWQGLNPGREILAALRPGMATIPGSKLIGISSPYSRAGVLYEMYKKYHGKEGPVLVWRAETLVMNPTINKAVIERAEAEDPNTAKSEWGAQFREDLETYLPTDIIDEAEIPGRYMLPCTPDTTYVAFVDPSGGRSDSFTLAIAHFEGEEGEGRIVLDRIEEWVPQFKPQDVIAEIAEILGDYRLESCRGDKYAAGFVTSAFSDCGISYENSTLDKSQIYLEFQPLMMQRRVDLLEHKKLREQLRGLEQRTRSGGRDSVDHYAGGHDDVANSVAGACVLAKGRPQDEVCILQSRRDFY